MSVRTARSAVRITAHRGGAGWADRRRGSQLVETSLIMLPLLALMFLALDAAWGAFVKATLEHAAREGVRYAVTGQTSGGLGQVASIEAVVKDRALGLLNGNQASTLSVQFLDATTLQTATADPVNQGGNLVQVSITNYQLSPLAPLLRSSNALTINITAADQLEPSPGGVPPAL